MPKRKKCPRLHNSFGSIRYLGKNRANPYAVHPPATERDESGRYLRPTALCYVPDWYTGFAVLTAYHAGTYRSGMEVEIQQEVAQSIADLDAFCRRVISDYSSVAQVDSRADHGPTLDDVYQLFYQWKYGPNAPKKLSASSATSTKAAYAYLSGLKDRPISELTIQDLQDAVNACERKYSTKELIVSLIHQIYTFAVPRELVKSDIGRYIYVPGEDDDEHGEPFTQTDLARIRRDADQDPVAEMLWIMCLSGFRIKAYTTINVDVDAATLRGGIKTKSGKDRLVPIHSAILPMVRRRVERQNNLLGMSPETFRKQMSEYLARAGIRKHTPHDCRHTFSMLCERYGVNEADRKRMLGHSFGNDITNGIYGHRNIDDLRKEIEKIDCGDLCPLNSNKPA